MHHRWEDVHSTHSSGCFPLDLSLVKGLKRGKVLQPARSGTSRCVADPADLSIKAVEVGTEICVVHRCVEFCGASHI